MGTYYEKHVQRGALIRNGALIGRRALNQIIMVIIYCKTGRETSNAYSVVSSAYNCREVCDLKVQIIHIKYVYSKRPNRDPRSREFRYNY